MQDVDVTAGLYSSGHGGAGDLADSVGWWRGQACHDPLSGLWCKVCLVSNLAHDGDDHPDAAGKNLDDAMALIAAQRFDGAGYLAGYVVECSLKTLIILQEIARHAGLTPTALAQGLAASSAQVVAALPGGYQKARQASKSPKAKQPQTSHDLETLSKEAVALASQPGAATARYAPPDPMAQPIPPSIYVMGWTESLRYTSSGTLGRTVATGWVDEARKVYQATVAAMRRDGVVF
jgi:hypothetical protein